MPLVPPILASAIEAEPFFSILKLAPLVYWPMDEASGNLINRGSLASKNALPTGSPTYRSASIVPANPTGTIELNGTSQYFTVTDAVITGTNPIFSFGVWISTDAGYPGQRTVFQQQDATSSYAGFRLYTSDNTLVFESHHTDGSSQIMTTYGLGFQLSDLTPMYVGLTADATYFTLYINGEQWNRVTRTTQAYVSGSDIFIGRAEGSYRYWEGKISHLFIDNSAMTDQQHFDIWRSGEYQLEPARADNFRDCHADSWSHRNTGHYWCHRRRSTRPPF